MLTRALEQTPAISAALLYTEHANLLWTLEEFTILQQIAPFLKEFHLITTLLESQEYPTCSLNFYFLWMIKNQLLCPQINDIPILQQVNE